MAAEDAGQPVPAKRFRSVYLDTGQSGRGPRGIALAAKVFGADRILFGTDSGPTSLVGQTIASVRQASITAEEKQQILVENGRRLLEGKTAARRLYPTGGSTPRPSTPHSPLPPSSPHPAP